MSTMGKGRQPMEQRERPTDRGAVVLMSVPLRGQTGPVAVWITASGWASASQRILGAAWLVTPNGVIEPERAVQLASRPGGAAQGPRRSVRWLPLTVRTLLKDVRDAVRAHRFRDAGLQGPWADVESGFVWQRHDLFQSVGVRAARRLGLPLVLFVDAPVVWEARHWGVRRPGWGRLLERIAERPRLRRADLVACVSEEVAAQVQRLGVPRERVLVTPCGVDLERFTPHADSDGVRSRYHLDKASFVVGWTGSFRQFHGVEVLLDAASDLRSRIPELALLFVGDGPERRRLEGLAAERGLHNVVFTGTVAHEEIPAHIAAMDVAVLTAPGDADFHYSPLKLKEYMACGRAIVAPNVGQIPSALSHGSEGLLVAAGDSSELAEALTTLRDRPSLRGDLSAAALARVRTEGTWDHQVERVLARLPELETRA
jgi:glycosyltransferase involved in cell wall biosynthesis